VVVRVGATDLCQNVSSIRNREGGLLRAPQKHIGKVMAHATVGYCFTGDPENGGDGLLIQLQRCQSYKVAQKAYRGKSGKAVQKGDCVLTDCNVTGTDPGTPDKPKFALRPLWQYGLLPSLDALVALGGQCEGAVVIHQEDNAGILTLTFAFIH
jgi:hypothetical protein